MSDVAIYKKDDGELIEVPFEEAVLCGYFYELPNGELAKKVNKPPEPVVRSPVLKGALRPIVSDALGFTDNDLPKALALKEAKPEDHVGIEFKQDPAEPRFYQVHCSSEAAKQRYMKCREMHDRNSINGSSAMLSPAQFEGAKRMVLREYSTKKTEQ